MNVSEQFFLYTIEFKKISGFISGLRLSDFWFYDINDFDQVTSYPILIKKNLSAKTSKYIPKCWKRSVKRKSNLNFHQSHIKIHLLINIFYIYDPNLLKLFWWQFLVPGSGFLISSATLLCIYVIFQLFQCYYYKKLFSEKFLYFFACTVWSLH